jgi:hypothetical protein
MSVLIAKKVEKVQISNQAPVVVEKVHPDLKVNFTVRVAPSSVERWRDRAVRDQAKAGALGNDATFSHWVRQCLNAAACGEIKVHYSDKEPSHVLFKPGGELDYVLQIRVSRRELTGWRTAARYVGLDVSEWLRQSLDWICER